MAPSYLGDFSLRGAELRKKGINRIGNLLVPNNNYCRLEEWILPIWDKMLEEQKTQVPKMFDLSLQKESFLISHNACSTVYHFHSLIMPLIVWRG